MAQRRSLFPADDLPPALLERARRGDHASFRALVDHYDEGLRALAYRLLGDRDRTDDALQEAYVKAFRALPRFGGRSRLGTWLYRIAYNACLDELDGGGRVVPLPLEAAEDRAAPESVATAVERRAALAEALRELSLADRAAVLLVDAHGFSYDEAAEILGVPPGTIASRLNRARRRLRAVLHAPTQGAISR